EILVGAAAVLAAPRSSRAASQAGGTVQRIRTRPIPRTGEELPVVGMGTYRTFDVTESDEARKPLREVLRRLFDAGGRMIDSSPMYGRAEEVIGALVDPARRAFLATKVWTTGRDEGIEQMRRSMQRMVPHASGRPFDLMQIHNLVDWRTHLATLRAWKEAGTIRYWGITHYTASAFDEMEAIVRSENPDFVQLPYSVGAREAEKRLLPACADRGVAVIVERPFEAGSLFRDAAKRPLPAWASEINCTSWAQIFLKFILGHPAVTCPIPATSNPDHMADDMRAGFGRLPDQALRKRMVSELTGG
ncbi:MAG TPA: aldo/keto reductase, partial [Myxococcales bacterium]|nr:aldo/keto reductase [Myxococcales bacterium]